MRKATSNDPTFHLLFVIGDAGGYLTLEPLIKYFFARGHEVKILINETFANSKFATKNLDFDYSLLDNIAYQVFSKLPLDQRPDIAVVTASRAGNLEKKLIKKARSLNIPTVSPVENWGPFAGRFSDFDLGKFKNHMAYLPDHLLVIDKFARDRAISENVPKDCISIVGSIPLETLLATAQKETKEAINSIRSNLGANKNQKIVVFASQALRIEMGTSSPEYPGYNETEVLSDICTALSVVWPDCMLIIKLHPFETIEKFHRPDSLQNIQHNIIKNISGSDIILSSDLVIGMISNFLMEAAGKNKPVISYQRHVKTKLNFVGTALNLMYFCSNIQELESVLKSGPSPLISAPEYFQKITTNATKQTISFIENLLP
jgi:hypothetical protein